jgi:hypothetical protein
MVRYLQRICGQKDLISRFIGAVRRILGEILALNWREAWPTIDPGYAKKVLLSSRNRVVTVLYMSLEEEVRLRHEELRHGRSTAIVACDEAGEPPVVFKC